jgi:uncharacterized protein (DUF2267 family)
VTAIQDMRGGTEFIDRLVAAAANLALVFASAPEELMRAELDQMRETLTRELTAALGAEAAHRIADAFVRAVIGQEAEIEGGEFSFADDRFSHQLGRPSANDLRHREAGFAVSHSLGDGVSLDKIGDPLVDSSTVQSAFDPRATFLDRLAALHNAGIGVAR